MAVPMLPTPMTPIFLAGTFLPRDDTGVVALEEKFSIAAD
jgi:hypothetical protein